MLTRRVVRAGVAVAATAVMLSALGACTTDTAGGSDSGDSADKMAEQCEDAVVPELPRLKPVDEGSGTKTVDSEHGKVELPVAPKAALGMYTTDVDMLTWLRYPLADSQPIRGDAGYTAFPCFFPREELTGIDTFKNFPEYDYEAVLLAEPDFILNGLGYDKKVVKRLPGIAPTSLKNDGEGEALSGEQIDRMKDIDYAFMTRGLSDSDRKNFDKVLDKAAENPQWKDLDFVKHDGIVGYEMEMTYGSPSGRLAFLEVVERALTS